MNNRLLILFITASTILFGCKQKPEPVSRPWTEIIIDADAVINVYIKYGNDTAKVIWYYRFFPPKSDEQLYKPDTICTVFSKAEVDSLYSLTNIIVSNPPPAKGACTDFAGNFEVRIFYGGYKEPGSYMRSVAYSGACDWSALSTQTKFLNDILQKHLSKMKPVFKK